ncbi:MAG: hypothetical protein AAF614_21650 [Chloroflexota bacterium]
MSGLSGLGTLLRAESKHVKYNDPTYLEAKVEFHFGMQNSPIPNLQDFLSSSAESLRSLAPSTMVYSVSGTRRKSALAGISSQGEDYTNWTGKQMLKSLDVVFNHGVKHILMPMLTPSQFNEQTPLYREFLWRWLDEGLRKPDTISGYQRLKVRVHIPFIEYLPSLHDAAAVLKHQTDLNGAQHHLWIFIVPEHNILWSWALEKLRKHDASTTPYEAIRTIYGIDIPPATLYLDFGKPIVSPDLLPPFLVGKLECYWTQRPGYSLDQEQFRRILYDYAYMRKTWQEDKTGRAEQALRYRKAWEEGPILGLGKRLGPFWYPQPLTVPEENERDDE